MWIHCHLVAGCHHFTGKIMCMHFVVNSQYTLIYNCFTLERPNWIMCLITLTHLFIVGGVVGPPVDSNGCCVEVPGCGSTSGGLLGRTESSVNWLKLNDAWHWKRVPWNSNVFFLLLMFFRLAWVKLCLLVYLATFCLFQLR